MSPFFRAVCGCAQGRKLLIGDPAHKKLLDNKKKQLLKEEFARDLVWFPVVVTIRGALDTYDEPKTSFVRVTYLAPSCPRAFVPSGGPAGRRPSCPGALVPSCPRALVPFCPSSLLLYALVPYIKSALNPQNGSFVEIIFSDLIASQVAMRSEEMGDRTTNRTKQGG